MFVCSISTSKLLESKLTDANILPGSVRFRPEQITAVTDLVPEPWWPNCTITSLNAVVNVYIYMWYSCFHMCVCIRWYWICPVISSWQFADWLMTSLAFPVLAWSAELMMLHASNHSLCKSVCICAFLSGLFFCYHHLVSSLSYNALGVLMLSR